MSQIFSRVFQFVTRGGSQSEEAHIESRTRDSRWTLQSRQTSNDVSRQQGNNHEAQDIESDPAYFAQLGMAINAAGIKNLEDGLQQVEALKTLSNCAVLSNDLHLIYTCLPARFARNLLSNQSFADFQSRLENFIEDLDQDSLRVASLIGLNLNQHRRLTILIKDLDTAHRFFVTIAVNELLSSDAMILDCFCDKYGLLEEDALSLKQDAACFAGQSAALSQNLGYANLEVLFRRLESLLKLMEVPSMNVDIANVLHRQGTRSIEDLADESLTRVESWLITSGTPAAQNVAEVIINDATYIVDEENIMSEYPDLDFSTEAEPPLRPNQTYNTSQINGLFDGFDLSEDLKSTDGDKHEDKDSGLSSQSDDLLDVHQPGDPITPILCIKQTHLNALFREIKLADQIGIVLEELNKEPTSRRSSQSASSSPTRSDDFQVPNFVPHKLAAVVISVSHSSNVYIINGGFLLLELRNQLKHHLQNLLLNKPDVQIVCLDVIHTAASLIHNFGLTEEMITSFRWFGPDTAVWLLDPKVKQNDSTNQGFFHYLSSPVKYDEVDDHFLDPFRETWSGFMKQPSNVISEPLWERCRLAAVLSPLRTELTRLLKQESLWNLFKDIEMPSRLTLSGLHLNGLGVDLEELLDLENRLHNKVDSLIDELIQMEGEIGKHIPLFKRSEKFNIGPEAMKRFKNHPDMIQKMKLFHSLQNRLAGVFKIKKSVKQYAAPLNMPRVTGRLNPFCPNGRVFMSNLALLQTPKDLDIDDEIFSPRSILCAQPGWVLVAADYSQLGVRVLAHFSGDVNLINILKQEDGDVFLLIASRWLNKDIESVTELERQQTKQICYGLINGMGGNAIAEKLNVSDKMGTLYKDQFMRTFPKVKTFIDAIKKKQFGEQVHIPSLAAPGVRHKLQPGSKTTQIMSTTIMRPASELFKMAMNQIRVKTQSRGLRGRLVLQIHDELIYEVPLEERDIFAHLVKDEMESCGRQAQMCVPLRAKIQVGQSWGTLEDVQY